MELKNWYWYALAFIVFIAIIKQCEKEPKIVTKTEIKYIKVTDTITNTIISKPKTVYVEKVKTIKGKDSIIYKNKPSETTINANQYETKLESNNASVDLKITTTGELLDVSGVITYENKETITTITKTSDKSGFYIYGMMPLDQSVSPEIGALYQLKNKLFISGGVQYNGYSKAIDFKIGLGIKIF